MLNLLLNKRRCSGDNDNSLNKRERARQTQTASQCVDFAERCGKIRRMRLTNFMCHTDLSIDFHNRVNILVGSNGCGKSAVMAALVVGLGSRAKITNRSNSLKHLIKTGEKFAKIEIIISNEGAEGLNPETYGNEITILRTFTLASSSYSIKNSEGNVVSRNFADLHRILLYHNIQVDNPILILNQDTARDFLKELNPVRNYKMFVKATHFDMIMEELTECLKFHRNQIYQLECFKKKITFLNEEIESLKTKLKRVMALEKLKEVLHQSQIAHSWALVEEQERALTSIQEKIDFQEKSKSVINIIVGDRDGIEKKLSEDVRVLQQLCEEKNTLYNKKSDTFMQIKTTVSKIAENVCHIKGQINEQSANKSRLSKQIEELKKYIAEQSQTNLNNIRNLNKVKLDKLKQLNANNNALIESTKQDLNIISSNKVQKEELIKNLRMSEEQHENNIKHLNSQIATYESSLKAKTSIYGPCVNKFLNVLQKYKNEGKLDEMPRGPIGSFIEVPKNKYRDVIENQLDSLLPGFLTCSQKDRNVLESILKTKFPTYHPPIITMKFVHKVYDVSERSIAPLQGTTLLMDEIKCDDPVVMNCLIDRICVENVLITDSKEIAERVTRDRENVPSHLRRVIVPQFNLEYYPDPHYRMYSLKIKPAQYLQVNVKERIRQLKMEQEQWVKQLNTIKTKLTKCLLENKNDMQHMEEKRILLRRLDLKEFELNEEINELNNYEYPDNNIDYLKNDLLQMERTYDELVQKLETDQIELDNAMAKKQELENILNTLNDTIQKIQTEISDIKKNIANGFQDIHNVNVLFRRNKKKLLAVEKELAHQRERKSKALVELGDAITAAEQQGERLHNEQSLEELISDIEKIQNRIAMTSKHLKDNPRELNDLITSKEENLHANFRLQERLEDSVNILNNSLQKRFNLVTRLQQHMVVLIEFTFQHILKMRNFMGSLNIDHKTKTLNISVIPRDANLKDAVDSTKALSGGERSYTTLAFLISLWACVDHPFYFLDEYDVFTDEVNREYMTRLLINEGKKRPNRQYVFLTPQDMEISSQDFIKIHKFTDPESC